MFSIREALELMLPSFQPLGSERVPLPDVSGRVLARDVLSQHDLPGFDHSAMDGYAVRSADVQPGTVLPVHAEIRAGGAPQPLLPGHAARIFTGAPLPPDADTVVIQENTQRVEQGVLFVEAPRHGAHLRRRGSELRAGDLLLRRGAVLGPSEVGLLAATGCSTIDVYRRPRVAILPTGDELRPLGAAPTPFTIVDSNSYALAAAVTLAGCEPVQLPAAPDRMDELSQRIEEGLAADVLLTVGGVSVGDYDLVSQALRDAGVVIGFHKVAIKPGKPLLFGQRGRVSVVGLPGNPVSALVAFEVFVRPCLLRMLGHLAPFPALIEVVLAEPYEHATGRTELVRARLVREGSSWVARLHRRQDSAALSSLTEQAALVIVPADRAQFAAGERLSALQSSQPHQAEPPY